MQTEVLFKTDSLGRITEINEPSNLPAPLFFLGRTKQGNRIHFNTYFPESYKNKIIEVINQDQTTINLAKLIGILNKVKTISNLWVGPAYVFPENFMMTSNAVKITNENKELLEIGFPNLLEQFKWRQPFFAIIKDGRAVSVCCSARKSTKAAEASVETMEAYQGQGYGTETVIAWANQVRKEGLLALYSTAWDNFSSQAIAKKLNLYSYGIDLHIS
nr:GNAT family N-acetyltransferase [Sporosarcina limicola]